MLLDRCSSFCNVVVISSYKGKHNFLLILKPYGSTDVPYTGAADDNSFDIDIINPAQ
jgi:hypothetical protein